MSTQPEATVLVTERTERQQSLLDKIAEQQAEVASRYQPVMDIDDAGRRYDQLKKYIETRLFEGEDYGKVPGVEKPFLFKSGAQKLCMLFGYAPHYEALTEIEDWTGAKFGEPLFYYKYTCALYKNGQPVGEGIGSANSWESKYRYRWISEEAAKGRADFASLPKRGGATKKFEPDFAIAKAETTGKYGHPPEYWAKFSSAGGAKRVTDRELGKRTYNGWEVSLDQTLYRIPNDGFPDIINTCQKQAEKRAYVEATLSATGASQFFTQDPEAIQAELPLATAPVGPEDAQQTDAPQEELPAKLPEELEGLFGPDAPAKGSTTAFEICRRELIEAFGADKGPDEYRKILALNGIKEKANSNASIKAALIQCWTTAKKVKALNGWKDPYAPGSEPCDGADATAADDWGPGCE